MNSKAYYELNTRIQEMTRSEILTEVAGIRQALNSARWVLNEEDIKEIAEIILRATERDEQYNTNRK